MTLILRQSLSQKLILTHSLRADCLQTIFPRAEAYLYNTLAAQRSLKLLAPKAEMAKYTCVMDFLFCQVFPLYQRHCFRYYERKGPLVKDIPGLTAEMIEAWDTTILVLLTLLSDINNKRYSRIMYWRRIILATRKTHQGQLIWPYNKTRGN